MYFPKLNIVQIKYIKMTSTETPSIKHNINKNAFSLKSKIFMILINRKWMCI